MELKKYKTISLAVLITAGLYLAVIAGPAGLLEASSDSAKVSDKKVSDRKGLPFEMVITADELRQKQIKKQNLILFDARSKKSYDESHIQGAILPLSSEYYEEENLFKKGVSRNAPDQPAALKESMKKYSKQTPIVAYCSSGGCQASAGLALQIKRLGFTDVKAMEDGIQTWGKKGYPLATGGEK